MAGSDPRHAGGARRAARHLVLAVAAALAAGPFLWMALSSLKTKAEIYAHPWALPARPSLANFARAWTRGNLGAYFANSLVVTATAVALVLAAGSAAAYVLARHRFRANGPILAAFALGLAVPVHSYVIPLYAWVGRLGLLSTRWALILPYSAMALPLAVYILRAYFAGLPREVEDAARIDGASPVRIFAWIALPLARPALATVAVLAALDSWNEFLLAQLFIQIPERKTLPAGLVAFYGHHSVDVPLLFAALTTLAVPMAILFVLFHRQLVAGIAAGAVKG